MAYCVFTNCLSIIGSGITPYTSLDSRSGVGLINNGQMMFVGSSDNSGPLGMVFQHVCGNGVCRADITATRYGISGNDLSLNVDSSDPSTGGGLYIKYRGSVGIGTNDPSPHNGRGFVVRGTAGDTRGIIELWDGGASGGKSVLQQVGGDTYLGQLAKGTGAGNLFFLTGGTGGSATISMAVLCAGNIGIGTSTPSTILNVASSAPTIRLNPTTQNNVTAIEFGVLNAGTCAYAKIDATNVQNFDTNLRFFTNDVGSLTQVERMRITYQGKVGIGTTTPIDKFEVVGALTTSGTAAASKANSGYLDYYNEQVRIGITGGNPSTPAVFRIDQYSCDYSIQRTPFYIASSGNIGIGCLTPSTKLQVAGGLKSSGTTELVWIGTCDATQPLILTFKAIGGATSADRGMAIVSTEAGLGSNFFDINETSTRTRFFSSGNVNIGSCAATSYRLNVNGAFYAAGSSKEYKTSICEYNTDSCMFMKLKPVTYDYKEEWKHLGKQLKSGTQIGLIAEDTAEVFPELAVLKEEENLQVVRNVDYEKLSIVLLAEVQKLRKEVDDLKTK
jgi:hypothetical protein